MVMNKEALFLQGFNLRRNLTENLYVTHIPLKWSEFFKDYLFEFKNGQPTRLVKTQSLKEIIYAISPRIVYCNDLYTRESNPYLILSIEDIDNEYLIYAIQVWGENQIVKIKDIDRKRAFLQWLDELSIEDLAPSKKINIPLLKSGVDQTNGKIFDLIPKLLCLQLMKDKIKVHQSELEFMIAIHKGKSRIYSKPELLFNSLKNRKDYFSLSLEFTLQTIPSESCYKVLYTSKVSRWLSKGISYKYLISNNVTVFKKISSNQLFTLEVTKDKKDIIWKSDTVKLYKEYFNESLPPVKEWINSPNKYHDNQLYGLYHPQMGGGITTIESGLKMNDKWDIYNEIKRSCSEWLCPIKGLNAMRVTGFSNVDYDNYKELLKQMTGKEHLVIEIYSYSSNEINSILKREVLKIIGATEGFPSYITIKEIYKPTILSALDPEKQESERHHLRISEIQNQVKYTSDLTVAFVLLPYKDSDGNNYFEDNTDPKKAIRAGLARQGRLTQFIDDRIESDISHRVDAAIRDMIRQLGYLPQIHAPKKNKELNQVITTGIHVINFKKTPYGNIDRMALFLTAIPHKHEIRVECPALWRGSKRYWEACLEFQKLATIESYKKVTRTRVSQDIKQKVITLLHDNNDQLLVVDSNGVTRNYWKMLTNKTLEAVEKEDTYTLKKLMFDNEKSISLTKEHNLRIIRTRQNSEVFDYLTPQKENGACESKSGLFISSDIFYSIGERPNQGPYTKAGLKSSKLKTPTEQYKYVDMIEFYPIHLKVEDEAKSWVSYLHRYRKEAIQYKGTLRNTLVLHLAMKLEEYIY